MRELTECSTSLQRKFKLARLYVRQMHAKRSLGDKWLLAQPVNRRKV